MGIYAIATRSAILFTAACVLSSGIAGCDDGKDTQKARPNSVSSSETSPESNSATAPVTKPVSGLVVKVSEVSAGGVYKPTRYAKYKILDIESGRYTDYKSFAAVDSDVYLTDAPPMGFGYGHGRELASPDWTKAIAWKKVGPDVHAGWVDQAGKFTDVTMLLTGRANDFSSKISHNGLGFDDAGYYYLRLADTNDSRKSELVKVQVSNPSSVTRIATAELLSPFWSPYSKVEYGVESCAERAELWLDEKTFLYRADPVSAQSGSFYRQMYVSSNWGEDCDPALDRALLPKAGKFSVGPSFLNPGKDRIIFEANTDSFSGLYTMPVSGGAPTRTSISSTALDTYWVIDWV